MGYSRGPAFPIAPQHPALPPALADEYADLRGYLGQWAYYVAAVPIRAQRDIVMQSVQEWWVEHWGQVGLYWLSYQDWEMRWYTQDDDLDFLILELQIRLRVGHGGNAAQLAQFGQFRDAARLNPYADAGYAAFLARPGPRQTIYVDATFSNEGAPDALAFNLVSTTMAAPFSE